MDNLGMANSGKKYELFVRDVQEHLFQLDGIAGVQNVEIEVNKIIEDNHGNKREFDIYWEFSFGGNTYRTVIECKDYKRPVSIDKIDAFIGKTRDVPGLSLVFVSKNGFQSGAKSKALNNGVRLLEIREPEDKDWIDNNGTRLINKIDFNVISISPIRIKKFMPILDRGWLLDNNVDIDNLVIDALNIELFIVDKDRNLEVSLYHLPNELEKSISSLQYGDNFTYSKDLGDNFFLRNSVDGGYYKLVGYTIIYSHHEPREFMFRLDFSNQLLAIVKDISKNKNIKVFRDISDIASLTRLT